MLLLSLMCVFSESSAWAASPRSESKTGYITTTSDGISDEHIADSVLVKFKPGVGLGDIAAINETCGTLPAYEATVTLDGKTSLESIAKEHLGSEAMADIIRALNKLQGANTAALAGTEIKVPSLLESKIPKIDVYSLKIAAGQTVPETVSLYQGRPDVEYAEPNYIVHAVLTPNDPSWAQQWGPSKIKCPEAWDTFTGGGNIWYIKES